MSEVWISDMGLNVDSYAIKTALVALKILYRGFLANLVF
jgi:hypothetical protein